MPSIPSTPDDPLMSDILALLGENRILALATIRPDGWPQATMVGYVHDDLTLYFAVGRTSQKLSNILRDPRVSIAVGQDRPDHLRGLSMAATVSQVTDAHEISRLNALLHERYPEQRVFAPREASAVILKASPSLISIVNLSKGPGRPQLVVVDQQTRVRPVEGVASEAARAYGPPPSQG